MPALTLVSPLPLQAPYAAKRAPAAGLSSAFKGALRHLASGVSVITTGRAPHRTGFTATSVSSLSVDPARIIVSVNRNSSSYEAIRTSGIFAVNFLAAHQVDVAQAFAGQGGLKGEARYAHAVWSTLESGASVLEGALANIDCDVEEFVERHSHAIVIGRVLAARNTEGGEALLYWRGRYDPFAASDIAAIA
jgi:flavin reductase (DIM6/NTAB) family NADH-FMN oxidoreductase RutF